MTLINQNFIGGTLSSEGSKRFSASNPTTGERIEPEFYEATDGEIDRAMTLAREAFEAHPRLPAAQVAVLLDAVADELVALGDALLERAGAETGLPPARLTGERARTVGQLKMFAELVREGSWVDARIDRAQPDRKPLPKTDLRRMLVPIGPVVVFGASNFPLAFSVAGGDTASAFAAGNPVVVKGHPAHPGTSVMTAEAIRRAVETAGLPPGWFSLVQGASIEVGMALVKHPDTCAVGFTGSLRGGRALYDAAAARPNPIPVFAEMGSVNPVFVLPGALRERGAQIAEGLAGSVTLGVGQMCTKPGLVFGMQSEPLAGFQQKLADAIAQTGPMTMLHEGIRSAFAAGLDKVSNTGTVRTAAQSSAVADASKTQSTAIVFQTEASNFLNTHALHEEIFGPASLLIVCGEKAEMEAAARGLEGQLTATLHGTPEDLKEFADLRSILERKAGRVVINGFPTGVEVCPSMVHGGPYPATTDANSTSVGTAAIFRFVRPVCYQNYPQEALPVELRDANERGLVRLVDGALTKESL